MRAVILAAGRGSRMGSVGDTGPKCLVELAGKALLDRQLAALSAAGASELGIVRGYRADLLARPGLVCFDNPRWSDTNMVLSLATAETWLSTGPVIVSYADIFYRREVVRELAAAVGELVIAYDLGWKRLWTRRFDNPLSDAETFRVSPSGRLLEIGARADRIEAIQGQYMGLLKFTPAAWRAVSQLLNGLDPALRDSLDMTGLLRRLLQRDYPVETLATEGNWGEIDSPADLALYERMARDGELTLDG